MKRERQNRKTGKESGTSILGRFTQSSRSRRFLRISMLATLFITMLILNIASAMAYYQSHNLSEIRNIDADLDMGLYDIMVGDGSICVDNTGGTCSGLSNDGYIYADGFYDMQLGYVDITGVTAGSGLTGGSTSGTATVNVGAGDGIDVAADSVAVDVTDVVATSKGLVEIATNNIGLRQDCGTNQVLKSDLFDNWVCASDNVNDADASASNELQDLWSTISSQSGSTSADIQADTLTINGAGIASTAVSGDTLTITATEVDGSTSNELQTISTSGSTPNVQIDLSNGGGSVTCQTLTGGSGLCDGTDDAGVTGSGSDGHISYWSGASTQTYDSDYDLYWDDLNNRLGIGTTNPIAQLEIEDTYVGIVGATIENLDTGANSHARVYLQSATSADAYNLYSVGSGTTYWNVGVDNSDADKFKISNAVTPSASADLTIDTAANVGIGDNSPDYKLDVAGNAGFNDYLYHNDDVSANTYMYFTEDEINFYSGAVEMLSLDEDVQDIVVINDNSYDVDFRIESNTDANAFFLRGSDGNVGIGTGSPASKLGVVASISDDPVLNVTQTSSSAGSHAVKGTGVYDAYGYLGVQGSADFDGRGIGQSWNGYEIGVVGISKGGSDSDNYGVIGESNGWGVLGSAYGDGTQTVYGIYGYATGGSTNYAGYFAGNAHIAGTLSKSSGSFIIDHPLEPKTEVLSHSFVESPEMLNIYKGNNHTLNAERSLVMPDWFVALNGNDKNDYSFAITPLNGFCGDYYVDNSDIAIDGSFVVHTENDCEFSWVVYAVRHDAYALKNPLIIEQSKTDAGFETDCYLSPDAFGAEKDGLDDCNSRGGEQS